MTVGIQIWEITCSLAVRGSRGWDRNLADSSGPFSSSALARVSATTCRCQVQVRLGKGWAKVVFQVKKFYLAGWSLRGGHCRWNTRAETVRQGVNHWLPGLHTKCNILCCALCRFLYTLKEEEEFLSLN